MKRESQNLAVRFVQQALSDRIKPVHMQTEHKHMDWLKVLKYSGDALITPALFKSLSNKNLLKLLPPEVSEALAMHYQANTERNSQILKVWHELSERFVQLKIPFVPLKGVWIVSDNIYGANERILSDIDVAVPKQNIAEAISVFKNLDYLQMSSVFYPENITSKISFDEIDILHERNIEILEYGHHLPVFVKPKQVVRVELHFRITSADDAMGQYLNELLPVVCHDWLQRQTDNNPQDAMQYKQLLSFQLAHSIHHSQIQDGFFKKGIFDYRRALDIKHSALENRELTQKVIDDLRVRFHDTEASGVIASYIDQIIMRLDAPLINFDNLSNNERTGIERFSRSNGSKSRRKYATAVHLLKGMFKTLRHEFGSASKLSFYSKSFRYIMNFIYRKCCGNY